MKIWDDGDTCPVTIKEISLRAAERLSGRHKNFASQLDRLPSQAI